MKVGYMRVYNSWKEREEKILIDVNFYLWLKQHNKEVLFNNYGYPMIEAFGKTRPLHCVCYYLNYRVWSEQWISAIHHRNEDKLDSRIVNLELVDWNDHGLKHSIKKGYYAQPRIEDLRIA